MTAKVTWLSRAGDKVERGLTAFLAADLRRAFPEADAIAVYDCFKGFTQDQRRKVVLGLEVRSRDAYHTHVVKLGARDVVGEDYEGWRKCVLKHNFTSRIFVSLDKRDLPGGRAAVVYQDAYQLFGSLDDAQGPQTLETVAAWAIRDDKPNPVSVERVIRQIYTDLYRCSIARRAPATPRRGASTGGGCAAPWTSGTRTAAARSCGAT